VYLKPNDVDNSSELALLNNEVKIYASKITQPELWGKLEYSNGEIQVNNPVNYQEAQENDVIKNYNPTVKKEVKKTITKKDTGPVENLVVLSLILMLLVLASGYYLKKQS
jgi:hypothetical protein